MKRIKKISFLSALIIIIGSTVGAGIFFKNAELFSQSQGRLPLVVTSWVIAGLGMITLGIALVELNSSSKTNGGTLEWFKNFLPSWLFKSSKKYVQIIFGPITMFTMCIYVIQSLQESGLHLSGIFVLFLSFCIFLWLATISLISLKASEKIQWLLTGLKFIPVFVVPIVAICCIGNSSYESTNHLRTFEIQKGLIGISPAIVIIGGIPAISFAFDGFYEIASLRNDLKRPKKLGSIICLGISIILSIYIFITIALALGSKDGTINGLNINHKFLVIMNVMTGIGVISIINGHVMGCIEQNASLYEEGESLVLVLVKKLLVFLNFKKISSRFISWFYMFISSVIAFLLLGSIGLFIWKSGDLKYGNAASIYSFCNIVVNYTSSLMFGLISLTIFSCLINRFTKKVKVKKNKFFIPCAIISSFILISGILFQFLVGVVDSTGYNGASSSNAITSLVIFNIILVISIIFGVLENKYWDSEKHKHLAKDTEIFYDQ